MSLSLVKLSMGISEKLIFLIKIGVCIQIILFLSTSICWSSDATTDSKAATAAAEPSVKDRSRPTLNLWQMEIVECLTNTNNNSRPLVIRPIVQTILSYYGNFISPPPTIISNFEDTIGVAKEGKAIVVARTSDELKNQVFEMKTGPGSQLTSLALYNSGAIGDEICGTTPSGELVCSSDFELAFGKMGPETKSSFVVLHSSNMYMIDLVTGKIVKYVRSQARQGKDRVSTIRKVEISSNEEKFGFLSVGWNSEGPADRADPKLTRPLIYGLTELGNVHGWSKTHQGAGDNKSDHYEKVSISSEVATKTFVQVVTGIGFVCGLTVEGEVVCWGQEREGTYPFSDLKSIEKIKHLSYALGRSGELVCGVTHKGDLICSFSQEALMSESSGLLKRFTTSTYSKRYRWSTTSTIKGPFVAAFPAGSRVVYVLKPNGELLQTRISQSELWKVTPGELSEKTLVTSATELTPVTGVPLMLLPGEKPTDRN